MAKKKILEETNPSTQLVPTGTTGTLQTLPDYAEQLPDNYQSSDGNGSYIKFVSSKSDKFNEVLQQHPKAVDGSAILVQDGVETLLEEVTVHTVKYFKYWGNIDNSGTLLATSLKQPVNAEDICKIPCVEAVHVLVHKGNVIPVIVSYRRATRTQFIDSIDGLMGKNGKLRDANDVWYAKSDQHKHSVTIPQVWARFTTTLIPKRGVVKTGSGKGSAYCAFQCKHDVVTIEGYKALTTKLDMKLLNSSVSKLNERIASISAGSK